MAIIPRRKHLMSTIFFFMSSREFSLWIFPTTDQSSIFQLSSFSKYSLLSFSINQDFVFGWSSFNENSLPPYSAGKRSFGMCWWRLSRLVCTFIDSITSLFRKGFMIDRSFSMIGEQFMKWFWTIFIGAASCWRLSLIFIFTTFLSLKKKYFYNFYLNTCAYLL